LLILDYGGVITCPQQIAARLKFTQQPLIVDVEAERLGGGVEIGAVDEQRDLFGGNGHQALSINSNATRREGDARARPDDPRVTEIFAGTEKSAAELIR